MSSPTILAFDTSGPFCNVALQVDGRVVAEAHAEMARGQAEALMPMIADLLDEAGIGRRHLDTIAVGTGPGNFTGLRVAVAAARGMALGLGKPAIGVTAFEVVFAMSRSPHRWVLASLPSPRGEVYLQLFDHGVPSGDARQAAPDAPGVSAAAVVGAEAATLAKAIGGAQAQEIEFTRPASKIAALAAEKLATGAEFPRPAPLYVRAPDAAPSKHRGPVMLS